MWFAASSCYCGGFLHVKKWPICASFDCFKTKICQKFGHCKIAKVGNTDKDRGNKSGSWSRTSVRLPPSMLSVISIWPIFYTFFSVGAKIVSIKESLRKYLVLTDYCYIFASSYKVLSFFFSNSLICYWVDTWQIRKTIFNSFVTSFTTSMICLIVKLQKWENGKLFCLFSGKL